MIDNLWGEVLWLLWKWEIPPLGAFFYLSVRLMISISLNLILLSLFALQFPSVLS